MLLETQLISRLALYFGTTWRVTCLVLTAILLMLVMANLFVVRFRPRRLNFYFSLLAGTLAVNYWFPWERLPLSANGVGVLLCLAYSFSIFLAGIVFAEAFRQSPQKSGAFGANIFGAVAGGLAQSISFVLGMKILLPVAVALYVAAGLCGWIALRPESSMPESRTR